VAHTFPPRAFRPAEVADPDALNEVLQDAAAKLGGRLNEHDVSSEVLGKLDISSTEAYYDGKQILRKVAPNWNVAAGFYATIGGAGPDVAATIKEDANWQAIVDDSGTAALSLDQTCSGGDTLVVFALCQHVGWNGSDTTTAAKISRPLMLQYAVRLDGVVVDETITGAKLWPDPPPQEWYRATPTGGAEYDYRHVLRVQNTYGVSSAVHATRLFHSFPVAAGTRTVDVAIRMLPMSDYNAVVVSTVQVLNRRLFVLRIKGQDPGSGDAPNVNVAAFDDGHVLTAADLAANSFNVLRDNVNNVANANLERGVFRHEHLDTLVFGMKVKLATPGAPTAAITSVYPGYGSTAAGWTAVDAGGGTFFRLDNTWDFSATPGVFVVLANVQVRNVKWTGGSAPSSNIQAIGILCLRITNSVGTVTVLGETEVCVNGHNFTNDAAADSDPIEDDLPLMWVVDTTTLSAPNKHIARVEVVGAVWDGAAGTANVEMDTYRGMICAFALKGVGL
jgi:hypothetical protein